MTARRVFLVAFAGFFLLAAAWAVALPVNGTYDESRHIIRAYAVVDGQWLPYGPNRLSFEVPTTLIAENQDCTWKPRPPKPASCQRDMAGDGRVLAETYVARYNPAYYVPVGIPLKIWPNHTGVLLARLISALLAALMLAAAAWLAARLGNRLLIVGVVLIATPTAVNLAGSVNPNGLEIAAGVLLFVALLALVGRRGTAAHDPVEVTTADDSATGSSVRRAALIAAGVAAFFLITLRSLGPALLAVNVFAIAVLAGFSWVKAQLRSRDTWLLFGGFIAAGLLAAAGWTVAARSPVGPIDGEPSHLSPGGIVQGLLEHRLKFYVTQIVGQFGYGETTISPLAILLWYALLAALVLPALWRATARARLVAVGLVVAGFAMLVALEFVFVPSLPDGVWFSHGRYAMAILCGAILVSVSGGPAANRDVVSDSGSARSGAAWRALVPVLLVLATAPVQLYSLARVMTRYQSGIESGLNPLGGTWHPAWGSATPLVAIIVATALLTAMVWRVGRRRDAGDRGNSDTPSTPTVLAH